MKEIFIIKDSLGNKIIYYHLLTFLIALPFDKFYSELALISLLVQTAIKFNRKGIISFDAKQFLPTGLLLLTLICTLYSVNKPQALKNCEKQLAFILFPLIFFITPINLKKYQIPLLKAMGLVCTLLVLYLFYDAIKTIRFNKLPFSTIFGTQFNNHNFSAPIDLHATYFSMYILLSIATFLYLFIISKKIITQIFYVLACLTLFVGLLQLSSRAAIIAFFIIINIAFPFLLFNKAKRWKYLTISVISSALVVTLLANVKPLKNKYVMGLQQDLLINNNISESRAARWLCAIDLIKGSPIYGYGSGSESTLLPEKYFDAKLYNSYLHQLNAHNEYLDLMLTAGIFGFLVYLFILFYGFNTAIQTKDILFCSFLIIVSIVSFSEDILDANKGIFFFAFFYSFFIQRQVGSIT